MDDFNDDENDVEREVSMLVTYNKRTTIFIILSISGLSYVWVLWFPYVYSYIVLQFVSPERERLKISNIIIVIHCSIKNTQKIYMTIQKICSANISESIDIWPDWIAQINYFLFRKFDELSGKYYKGIRIFWNHLKSFTDCLLF